MKHTELWFSFLFTLTLIWTTEGLRCPSCTYLTLDTDQRIASLVKSAVNILLGAFQDPKCAQDIKGLTPGIQEETCEEIPGEVSRCSFYKGSVSIKIGLLFSTDVKLNIYERGCYHSAPINVPSNGCHDRENVKEDKSFIQHTLQSANHVLPIFKVAEFSGEICVCTDTYCRESSGVGQGAKLNITLLYFSALLYFTLF